MGNGETPTWLSIATRRDVVRRATTYMLVVGTILISINHVPALIKGDVTGFRIFQILLTYCVPYAVTTFASTQAIRAEQRKASK
ncbi:MAG: nitrate/nitrite transporter NrtS [Phycisphaeraceae bacterium]|nr:nitrate/nitrite transporter NrtS [Phycisphaeraceae bacterium]